ncbi:MAG: glycosyltransferase family 2 protein [Gammaproteobacteria bacterium]
MTAKSVAVSIGMPVYNGEKYLRAALDCFLHQTFSDFELIISDNASMDATEAICRDYAARDRRIHYFRNTKNIGAAKNFNRVLALASGKYFKWASHDDLHEPDYLERCVSVLDRDPSVVLCNSKTQYVDSKGVRISLENDADAPVTASEVCALDDPAARLSSPRACRRFSDILTTPLACVDIFGLSRSDVLKSTSGLGPYFGSDRVLLAELALRGRIYHVPAYLFSWRNHVDQATRQDAMSRQRRHGNPNDRKLPRFRFLPGYCRALWKVPLPLTERLLCHVALFKHYALQALSRCGGMWRSKAAAAAPADIA